MINKRNHLWIYIKIFITTLIFLYTANISVTLIQKLSNFIFNTRFIIDYNIFDFSLIIPFYLIFSLFMLSKGIYITKGIRIEDKDIGAENIIEVMDKLNWKLREENEDTIIFKSPFILGLWMDEIIIEFIDNEVHITGPREYVNRVITLSKFSYTPYEIKRKTGG